MPPVSLRQLESGIIAWTFIADHLDTEQNAALWISKDTQTVKGLLVIFDDGSSVLRPEPQDLARKNNLALFSLKLAVAPTPRILDMILSTLGEALNRPELTKVPWVLYGRGATAKSPLDFVQAHPSLGERVLSILLEDPPEETGMLPAQKKEAFSTLPIFTLQTKSEALPGGQTQARTWANTSYLRIQSRQLPYAMALAEIASANRGQNVDLLSAFIADMYAIRVPKGHDFGKNAAELKPFPYRDGVLAGPFQWKFPPRSEVRPATEEEIGAVWLPSESFAKKWFAYHQPNDEIKTSTDSSDKDSAAAQKPSLNLLLLGLEAEDEKLLLSILQADPSTESRTWTLRYEADFEGKNKGEWYEYFAAPGIAARRRENFTANNLTITNGVLSISGAQQSVAMLRYDWPKDVAVEYKARSDSETPCDLSVILHGTAQDNNLPWSKGMVYQFGGYRNTRSFWNILNSPREGIPNYDDGARITSGKWHQVRVEKQGSSLRTWIDGEEMRKSALTVPEDMAQRLEGRRIGFYTYEGSADFDDVKIYTLAPSPEKNTIDDSARKRLVSELFRRAYSPVSQQRVATRSIMQDLLHILAPTFKEIMSEDGFPEERREEWEKALESIPPDL